LRAPLEGDEADGDGLGLEVVQPGADLAGGVYDLDELAFRLLAEGVLEITLEIAEEALAWASVIDEARTSRWT
jgi:hypothetical protein